MSDRKRILITGVSGLLGSNLAYAFKDRHEVTGTYCSHPIDMPGVNVRRTDITDLADIAALLQEVQPQAVIHGAALANPDTCEEQPDLAERINVLGVRNVVAGMRGLEAKLLYVSTDCVFDGNKGDYRETDAPCPLQKYGETKLRGEAEAAQRADAIIARVNIFGWDARTQRSLGEWVRRELSAGRRITGFTDAIFSSIYTMTLGELFDEMIQNNLSGLYHCASSSSCSKYDFAVQVAEAFGLDTALISPGSLSDFHFKAPRAKTLDLNTQKLREALGQDIPTMKESIAAFYADFQAGIPQAIAGCCVTDSLKGRA